MSVSTHSHMASVTHVLPAVEV